ncbi:replication factor C subunit 4 isoform X1 [Halyomorpha halys]|uniref:replication factor C subunit 4 isoform X1 n=2 Tax=Halyomorpha halys TaxID=286706 RepID=UPI0006D4D159|nr:replication factor C subunit 4 isoform X1 [Halyomorpha halys]
MNLEGASQNLENKISKLDNCQLNDSVYQEDSDFKQFIKDMERFTDLIQEKKDEDELFKSVHNIAHPRFVKELWETDRDNVSESSLDSDTSGDEVYWKNLEKKMDAFLNRKVNKEEKQEAKISKESKPELPNKPWVEKYRPKTVDDVVEQTEIVSVLKQVLAGADLPHFLFYGPPGTGKTSTILAAARELFGNVFRDRILELNASDDRGIQVIRDKVKNFAQLTASSVRPDGSPCPPYKIVILDEADSMTGAAQAALRRTMEKETKTTRFCLICNYVSSIIEPLTSRCMKFRFKPLGTYVIKSRLEMICKEEGVSCDTNAISKIVDISEGDLRQAITVLQSCARLKGGDKITEDDIVEISNLVPEGLVFDLIESCKENVYEKIQIRVTKIIYEAYPLSQIVTQIHKYITSSNSLTDTQKAKISEDIAECSSRLQRGASEYTQLLHLCCSMGNILQGES